MRTDVLGVGFDNTSPTAALARADELLAHGGFHYIVTPNPEFVVMARENPAFHAALSGADLVLADGIGIVYAAKILGRPLVGRCPGIDFAAELMARMNETGARLFLLGAAPGVAELAGEKLGKKHPKLCICGTHDGYFKDNEAAAQEIKAAAADVVFVCLGAPKQEFFMAEFGPQSGAKLMLGLGGALDVFAGKVRRAPPVFQKLGLEWLYRLACEPSRIGRMAKLPLFLVTAVGARLKAPQKS